MYKHTFLNTAYFQITLNNLGHIGGLSDKETEIQYLPQDIDVPLKL